MSGHDIVVIGASAGGMSPLRVLLEQLPANIPASFIAVIHGSLPLRTHLPNLLQKDSRLPVRFASDNAKLEPGVLLLAPPDQHLIVHSKGIRLTRGPRENQWRPSIDVLFRSAAIAFGARTIGVVLSGALDDGTAGLVAIRQCGGRAVVQDPEEALFPAMPASALRNVDGALVTKAKDLAATLTRLIHEPPPRTPPIPRSLKLEVGYAEQALASEEDYEQLGELSIQTCPECGGPLRKAPGDMLRFRCRTGHAFSGLTLEEKMRLEIESSLWSAIRLFQQRANLDRALAHKESEKCRLHGADQYASRAAEAQAHAAVLHDLLVSLPNLKID